VILLIASYNPLSLI